MKGFDPIVLEQLQQNLPSLTSLDYIGTQIGDDDAAELAHALKDNTVLTSLHLDYNAVGGEGARELSISLQNNSHVRLLL